VVAMPRGLSEVHHQVLFSGHESVGLEPVLLFDAAPRIISAHEVP